MRFTKSSPGLEKKEDVDYLPEKLKGRKYISGKISKMKDVVNQELP